MRNIFILCAVLFVVSVKAQNIVKQVEVTYTEVGKIPGSTMKATRDTSFADPLFIVDGVQHEKFVLKEINPNDIQSINVLKGKSAIALYGTKGENGVIIIKTRGCKLPSQGTTL